MEVKSWANNKSYMYLIQYLMKCLIWYLGFIFGHWERAAIIIITVVITTTFHFIDKEMEALRI